MSNTQNKNENFIYNWRLRKYHLSLIGKNSQSDWNVVLFFMTVALIISAVFGWINYKHVMYTMNKETEEVFFKSRKKDVENIGKLVSDLNARRTRFEEIMTTK